MTQLWRLSEISKFNKSSMREAITALLSQANRATEMIQTEGPELISSLTDQYVTETVDIIDDYVQGRLVLGVEIS